MIICGSIDNVFSVCCFYQLGSWVEAGEGIYWSCSSISD